MESIELTPAPESSVDNPNLNTTVYVTNISTSANEKTVSEFFAFCGKIIHVKLNTYAHGSEAIVVFETEAAAKTALLLTNALIADRPITVIPYGGEEEKIFNSHRGHHLESTTELKGQDIPNKPHTVPAENRSKTSVIASMVAAGYTLGSDAVAKAKEVDEQNHISLKAAAAAAVAKEKLLEIDRQLKISQTVENISNAVSTKANEVDQAWKISENVGHAFQTVQENMEQFQKKASENPTVQTTVNTLSQWSQSVANAVAPATTALKTNVDDIKQQSLDLIEEKRRARSASSEHADPHSNQNREAHDSQPPATQDHVATPVPPS